MTPIDTSFYEKKKTKTFYISIGFLSVVICITLGLYLYLQRLEVSQGELYQNIAKIDAAISELQSNKQIQIYSMYQQHKGFFDAIGQQSQIPLFITHFKKQFAKYGMQASGFNYNTGIVTMNLSSQTNESGYAYQKIVKFVDEYAQDEKALFSLQQPILNFSGYDRISYEGTFYLK